MDFDRRAAEIIEGAEKALADLAAEAASARDYARATSLLALAQRLGEATSAGETGRVALLADSHHRLAASHLRNGDEPPLPRLESRNGDAQPVGRKKGAPSTYPRFKREDDTLVKIGWSKSDRATYEHRSPRDVLNRLVEAIKRVAVRDERFTTEDIMPLQDDQGAELPSYQAYLCLAWLVVAGILEKHGRQGYTVAAAGDLDAAVESTWQQLPRR
jgi:hypothetical protein